jgi:hypothetical protein
VLRLIPTAWEDSDEMELVLMSCVPLNCCNRCRSADVGVGVGLGRRGWLDAEVLRVFMTGTANANILDYRRVVVFALRMWTR